MSFNITKTKLAIGNRSWSLYHWLGNAKHSLNYTDPFVFKEKCRNLYLHTWRGLYSCEYLSQVLICLHPIQAHQEDCKYGTLVCPHQCGQAIRRKSLDNHIRLLCPKRRVRCDHCAVPIPLDELMVGCINNINNEYCWWIGINFDSGFKPIALFNHFLNTNGFLLYT